MHRLWGSVHRQAASRLAPLNPGDATSCIPLGQHRAVTVRRGILLWGSEHRLVASRLAPLNLGGRATSLGQRSGSQSRELRGSVHRRAASRLAPLNLGVRKHPPGQHSEATEAEGLEKPWGSEHRREASRLAPPNLGERSLPPGQHGERERRQLGRIPRRLQRTQQLAVGAGRPLLSGGGAGERRRRRTGRSRTGGTNERERIIIPP